MAGTKGGAPRFVMVRPRARGKVWQILRRMPGPTPTYVPYMTTEHEEAAKRVHELLETHGED